MTSVLNSRLATLLPLAIAGLPNCYGQFVYFPNISSIFDPESGSTATEPKVYPEGAVWDGLLIQRVITLTVIMLVTLTGNSIIISVLSRSRYRKRSSRVNIFILNLAIGDLAVCFVTMTSELIFEVFGEWILGNAGCKSIVYGQIVTLASTTFILTSMTYDRYQAICRPLKSTGGVAQAKKMILASWLTAFILAIPQIFIFVQVESGVTVSGRQRYECLSKGYTSEWQRKLYFSWLTIYILVVPFVCICFCYANILKIVWQSGQVYQVTKNSTLGVPLRRSFQASSRIPSGKIKTLKLTICILVSFVVCWTPYFVVHNIRIYSGYRVIVPPNVLVAAETLALLNSALNPVFYGYFNVRVRKGFRDILLKKTLSENGAGGNRNSELNRTRSLTLEMRTIGRNSPPTRLGGANALLVTGSQCLGESV